MLWIDPDDGSVWRAECHPLPRGLCGKEPGCERCVWKMMALQLDLFLADPEVHGVTFGPEPAPRAPETA